MCIFVWQSCDSVVMEVDIKISEEHIYLSLTLFCTQGLLDKILYEQWRSKPLQKKIDNLVS